MAQLIASRGTQLDMEKCRALAGNNQFDMSLIAAQRLRELKARARESGSGQYMTAVDALLDLQNGQVNLIDYMAKIK